MKYSGIGGQAVIEGIMMKNADTYATAVRKPDGTIAVEKDTYEGFAKKCKVLKIPFVRGIFVFIDSMVVGSRSLRFSASFFEDDEDSKESKFEAFLKKIFGEKIDNMIMTLSMIFSFAVAIGVFMLLPMALSNILKLYISDYYIIAIVEGFIRVAIFIGYILLISLVPDIKRTFMYHGAEHKCINCLENGLELNVENVLKSSREHKRCGTSFIFIVMIISILCFMVIRVDNIWLRAVSRIVLVPVIAGVSYEFLSLTGKYDNFLVNILSKPGLMMQGLTTKEPTKDMAEVAIVAVEEVFDWREYLRENFSRSDL